jgi:hypothetical protein
MVRYQLTGEQAERFLQANAKSRIAQVVSDEPQSLTFVVRSLSDVKAVAAYLGVEVPEGRGRFPMARLDQEIERLGHKLDRSNYGETDVSTVTYRVSLMEVVGAHVHPRTGIVTADQVREYTGSRRGRVAKDAVASAAINVHGWGDTYLSDSVQVERQD